MPTIDTVLDFRSDTVTTPTDRMRQAMAQAKVGDDVFGEDPTVNQLEKEVAGLFGRETSLFVASGTMANLIGLAVHCSRGHEVILERRTHSFIHEVGGGSALLGVVFNPLDSSDGFLNPEQLQAIIRPKDIHEPISRLLVIENTANLAGGLVFPIDRIRALFQLAKDRDMRLHMDGARIWNAAIASGVTLTDYAREVHTLTCCLSKGLGCPVGSMLIGDQQTIDQARWYRKMLGGGMRQAGILAAAGLYAIEHHIERLAQDHQAATELAKGLRQNLDKRFRVQEPQTNILLVHTDCQATTAATLETWKQSGVLALAISDCCIRLVTHLDIPAGGAEEALRRIQRCSHKRGR